MSNQKQVYTIQVISEAIKFDSEAIECVNEHALKLKLVSLCKDGYMGYEEGRIGMAFVPAHQIQGVRVEKRGVVTSFTYDQTPMRDRVPVPPFPVESNVAYEWECL